MVPTALAYLSRVMSDCILMKIIVLSIIPITSLLTRQSWSACRCFIFGLEVLGMDMMIGGVALFTTVWTVSGLIEIVWVSIEDKDRHFGMTDGVVSTYWGVRFRWLQPSSCLVLCKRSFFVTRFSILSSSTFQAVVLLLILNGVLSWR